MFKEPEQRHFKVLYMKRTEGPEDKFYSDLDKRVFKNFHYGHRVGYLNLKREQYFIYILYRAFKFLRKSVHCIVFF